MGKPRATIERRQLGAELRRLREAAGKQQRDAAAAIECDVSQISRVERGERAFKVLEIEALLDFYDAPEESRTQIGKLAQLARQRQPRRMYSDTLPGAFRRLSDHEQDATEIYYSDSELIPGLLQTESYARALIRTARSASTGGEPGDVEARVQFRLDRQELLKRSDAPYMWFVIGEAALRRPIGHNEVLREQLGHLLDLIERHEHLVIQVAPLDIVDHPLLGGPLQILRFGGIAPDIVQQPTFIGAGVYLVDEEDIAECARAFDRLKAVALGPEESRTYITKRLEELDNEL
ncbi:Helix-turn-helix domain-containing protein [Actinopolyspora lacussalsi subsp. righensis]|uniref:Helix-turn-helix domain-containing protein n=1 Tax=Actinopolyspora righensis TaxID=995060 RepID=A0A1I6YMV4_9ACTN|nr:helix-turn-helix transcriptional regulator [Actinopolyspora righensis]SFT51806.1 Helix-turn-helix domain-containing protein [Actinopolyspora righensis]